MKTILVPVDFSNNAPAVTSAACAIAKAFTSKIILLHIASPEPEFIGYRPGPQSVRDSVAHELVDEHHKLQKMEQEVKASGLEVKALVIQGYPAEKIIEEAKKINADLIVVGSHGHGTLRKMLVGSVIDEVVRLANCPVMVVPNKV